MWEVRRCGTEVAEMDERLDPAGEMLVRNGTEGRQQPQGCPMLPTVTLLLAGQPCWGFPASRLWAGMQPQLSEAGKARL